MKDARVSIWTNPTTHATGTTTNNGPTVDLFASGVMAGGTSDGTGDMRGVGGLILQTNVTGTGQVSQWYAEHSTDASTWLRGKHLGTSTLDVAAEVVRIKFSFATRNRYWRLSADNTGTGTSTSRCYPEDFDALKAGAEAAA